MKKILGFLTRNPIMGALAGALVTAVLQSSSATTPLGFAPYGFTSSDYFPLLPNFGYFLLGAVVGKRAYAGRKSLFPRETPPLGLFRWMGRHSLMIYLLHQPVLAAIVAVMAALG